MNMRTGVALLLAGLLGGCATVDNRYRDGSHYSPAGDGRGDYYYGPERRDEIYLGQGPFGFYPGPFGRTAFDGYCSARFYGCVPWWYGYGDYYDIGNRYGFVLFLGGGWFYDYNPYWSPYPYRRPDRRPDPRHADSTPAPPDAPGTTPSTAQQPPPPPNGGRRFRPRPEPDPTLGGAEDLTAATLVSDEEAPAAEPVRHHRAPAPAMPAPAGSSVRIRYPVVDPPERREPSPRAERPTRSDRPSPPPGDRGPAFPPSSRSSSEGSSSPPARRTRDRDDGLS